MERQISFYVIKLINKDGKRGFLIDRPDGIHISLGGIVSDVKQFDTEKDAYYYIKENKLERKGVKAYIRTNLDLVDESQIVETKGITKMDNKPFFHLENHLGEKLFYDPKMEAYYFKQMGDSGFPLFDDEKKVRLMIKEAGFQQSSIFLIKHLSNDNVERKLIQVYGQKKDESGNLKEPEYFNFDENENLIED